MAIGLTDSKHYTDIANAIRGKTGSTNNMTPAQMAAEIQSITTGGNLQTKTVTPTNQDQVITPDAGYDGLSSVTVKKAEGLVLADDMAILYRGRASSTSQFGTPTSAAVGTALS